MPVILLRKAKEIPIPEGVTVRTKSRQVWVEGPRGKLYRSFKHAQVTIRVVPLGSSENSSLQGRVKDTTQMAVLVEKRMSKKKRCAVVKSIAGHINNMFVGVTKGFRYKMKLVYAHFPINAIVTDEGKKVQLRNYIGQKGVRHVNMARGVTIKEPGTKDEYWLEGNDIDAVSISAAKIWQSCRVTDKDIRKFLDGVYVYAKGTMGEETPI